VSASTGGDRESELLADPRLAISFRQFNNGDWYACHDGLEALWHETQGPLRQVLQGFLQLAVAELHLERGNKRGATLLMGEGLGRLSGCGSSALGIDLDPLRTTVLARLQRLQAGESVAELPPPGLLSSHPATRPEERSPQQSVN
jgi:predicted metal-dependent hydrolase